MSQSESNESNKPVVHIVTVANKSEKYYEILKESCIRNGCKLTTLGFNEKWGGFLWIYEKTQKFLKTVDPNDIVVVIDGFDVIMNEHIDVFKTKYEKFGKSIILSVIYNSNTVKFFEKRIFGSIKYQGSEYWLCAGLCAGKAKDLIEMFDLMNIKEFKINDNQLLLTKFIKNNSNFVNDKIAFDTKMEIFTNAARPTFKDYINKDDRSLTISCKDGKILNNLGTASTFVHGPGGVDLKQYLEKIGYTNIPNVSSNPQVNHYLGLFIGGMFWYDWVVVFIILIALVFVIIMVVKLVKHKLKKRKLKKSK